MDENNTSNSYDEDGNMNTLQLLNTPADRVRFSYDRGDVDDGTSIWILLYAFYSMYGSTFYDIEQSKMMSQLWKSVQLISLAGKNTDDEMENSS